MRKSSIWLLFTLLVISFYINPSAAASSCTHTVVNYGDTVTLCFDERQWVLGADNAKTNIFFEYVTDGQTVENWKELVTLQMFKGLQNKINAEQGTKQLINTLFQTCGDKLTVSVIRNNPLDYMVEWKVNGHPQIADQHEIDRFIVGKESLVILHYTMKTPSLTPDIRAKWIDILDSATVQ